MALRKITPMTTEEISRRLKNPEQAIAMHREAIEAGVPFGVYLERADPTPRGEPLDAFERQCAALGIVTRSNPAAGWWASTGDEFFGSPEGRALYIEFFARQWRSVRYQTPQQRAIFLSGDSVVGSQETPWNDAGPFWNNQFGPAIPLSEVVAMTSPISGEDYRSLYMTYDAEKLRMFRVGESAEIPLATLTTSDRSIRLKKYGRGLRATYEQMRRSRVDKIAWWIRWQAIQSEVDKVAAALDVLVNGDGNANTAATEYNLLTLDPTTNANELSLLGWMSFRMKWENPYQMTTALMRVEEALQLVLLNTGSGNVPLANVQLAGIDNQLTPINFTGDAIRYGWLTDAPDGKIVGFDRRFALEEITEIGSDIQETERFITNQTEVVVMTENSAFSILDPAASKILDLAE